jgi:hypothetical protein
MRKDQSFVIVLTMLILLSGCIDQAIGPAEAQEETPSVVDSTIVYTIHLEAGENYSHSVTDTVFKIETVFQHNPGNTALRNLYGTGVDISCSSGSTFSISIDKGDFIPTIPGENCTFNFNGRNDGMVIVMLTQHPASALN